MIFARKYTAHVGISIILPFACRACGVTTPARVAVAAAGVGISPIMTDDEGAKQRAEERAARAAGGKAARVLSICACPKCGVVDGAARRRFYSRGIVRALAFGVPIFAFAIVFGVLGVTGYALLAGLIATLVMGAVAVEVRGEMQTAIIGVAFDGDDLAHVSMPSTGTGKKVAMGALALAGIGIVIIVGSFVRSQAVLGRREEKLKTIDTPGAWKADEDGMIAIAGSTYTMGRANGVPEEHPERKVTVAAFRIDATEVTTGAYQRCVDAKACRPAATTSEPGDGECNAGKPNRKDHPINCVDPEQAETYCAWAGKRLVTDEEWELAARGPNGRIYPWGDALPNDQLYWHSDLPFETPRTTSAVAKYPEGATPEGVMDLAGNVFEIVATKDCADQKPTCGWTRRGGGYLRVVETMHRAAYVYGAASRETTSGELGFRCAR